LSANNKLPSIFFHDSVGADATIDYTANPDFLENDNRLKVNGKGIVDVVFDPFSWLYRSRTIYPTGKIRDKGKGKNNSMTKAQTASALAPVSIIRQDGWYLDIASSPNNVAIDNEVNTPIQDPLHMQVPEGSVTYRVSRVFDYAMNCWYGLKGITLSMCSSVDYATTTITSSSYAHDHSYSGTQSGSHASEGSEGDSLTVETSAASSPPSEVIHVPQYHYKSVYVKPSSKQLRQLARLVRAGHILPVVSKKNVFPFSAKDIQKCHDYVFEGHAKGKCVVAICSTAGIRGGALGSNMPMPAVWEQEGKE
jgi:hypothetical protein